MKNFQIISSNKEIPLISIAILAYNHELYIAEAIEGILMQQTSYPYKIVIAEDCSTDSTREIILKYQQKYPEKFKLILQNKNVGSKQNNIDILSNTEGKYIACCEGDDYWTDPLKIQKQIDFLEANKDFVLCFHNCEVFLDENGIQSERGLKVISKSREYNSAEILKDWIIPTASVVFRNVLDAKSMKTAQNAKFIYGDIVLFLSLAESGKFYGFSDCMSVYRGHIGGVTNIKGSVAFDENYSAHLEEIIKVFGKKYTASIKDILGRLFLSLALSSVSSFKILKFFHYILKAIKYDYKIILSFLKNRFKKT